MGKWIKFDGRASDSKNYAENVIKLKTLVQDTPWCTKTLASTQLEQGDFYVFIDKDNKPHIAVKMNGNEIDEVRGIKTEMHKNQKKNIEMLQYHFQKIIKILKMERTGQIKKNGTKD